MLAHRSASTATPEDRRPMPDDTPRDVPGRALVTRRALEEIVRAAVLGSYGVTGLAETLRGRLGLGRRAIRVALRPEVAVDVRLDDRPRPSRSPRSPARSTPPSATGSSARSGAPSAA